MHILVNPTSGVTAVTKCLAFIVGITGRAQDSILSFRENGMHQKYVWHTQIKMFAFKSTVNTKYVSLQLIRISLIKDLIRYSDLIEKYIHERLMLSTKNIYFD